MEFHDWGLLILGMMTGSGLTFVLEHLIWPFVLPLVTAHDRDYR